MISENIPIIKEYIIHDKGRSITFLVRTTLYNNSFEYYNDLAKIAMEDFILTLDEIKAVEYGGDTHKGQRGVEFTLPNDPQRTGIPKDYTEVCSLKSFPHSS